jgi:hypothetical protein
MGELIGINEKLSAIQAELKAPKDQRNGFGNYNYRNCESILEAVKPICQKFRTVLKLTDDIVQIGDRYYVKATAILKDLDSQEVEAANAFAREAAQKKGSDDAQITGATSSYARKYALCGLFSIDDSKLKPVIEPDAEEPERASRPETQPTMCDHNDTVKLFCTKCKKAIVPVKKKETGEEVRSVIQIAEKTKELYGRELCWDCACKEKKHEAAG